MRRNSMIDTGTLSTISSGGRQLLKELDFSIKHWHMSWTLDWSLKRQKKLSYHRTLYNDTTKLLSFLFFEKSKYEIVAMVTTTSWQDLLSELIV